MISYNEMDLGTFWIDNAWGRIRHVGKHRQPIKTGIVADRKIPTKIDSAADADNLAAA